MPNIKIEGDLLGGAFTVNGAGYSEISPLTYQNLLAEIATPNYKPMEGYVVLGRGSKPWLIRVKAEKKGVNEGEIREVIDCQTMYSAANAGHGNMNTILPVALYLLEKWAPTGNGINNHLQLPALKALLALTGLNARVMTKIGGAEAVETAIKAARRVWWARHGMPEEEDNRYGFIVVAENAFHGRTLGVTSLFQKGDSSRKGFGPFPDGTLWVPYNDIHALENVFVAYRDRIAAVLLEPIQGEGGIIIPNSDYLLKVKELCSWDNALLILDEIQTGFGRTGKNFAFEHSGVVPDILLLAKALGGGAIPASAIIGRKDVVLNDRAGNAKEYDILSYLAIDDAGEEGATWAGSALVCMAILASIKELCDNNLAEKAAESGVRFVEELKALQKKYPLITDVRGKGLMVGIDFSAPNADGRLGVKGRAVSHALLSEGVWAYYTGDKGQTLRFLPPLATPPEVLSDVVLRLERAVQSFI